MCLWWKASSPAAIHERWGYAVLVKPKFSTVEMTNDLLIPSILGLLLSQDSMSLFGSIDLFV